jgi:hypothetical protein
MKIGFVLGSLCLGLSAHALVGYGFKGGGSYSKHAIDGISASGTSEFGIGYQGGLSLQAGALGFGAVVDVLYSQRKFGSSVDLFRWTEDALLIPVQIRYAFIPLISITAGGYYLMGLGESFSVGEDPTEASYADSTPVVKKGDYGAVFGLQISIPLGKSSITIEPRYYLGLANRLDSDSAEMKMTSADLLVGFQF